jgi:DNA repair exonuclease SbcCD nuclease subunit
MKIAILGDTHFGQRGDSVDFHRYIEKFYDNVFFPYLIENKIDRVYQLGDLFDRRKFINFNSLYLCRKYFFNKLRDNNIKLFTLLGNHDIAYKNTLEVNSSQLLLKEYNNVFVIDKPDTDFVDGVAIDVIPWICSENEEEVFRFAENSKSQICFGHFEIDGFEMDRGNVFHGGLDRKKLNKYDVVLSGHFHHKSDDGHIFYVGTPSEMTWADYNDPRGFHVFDVKTREMEFIRNPYRMFHKITYDDGVTDFEYWKNYDYSQYKDCYVKVISVNKQNPYLFDTVIDNLYKSGVTDLTIVEDFTEEAVEDGDIVDQAEDTITILSRYIDGLTLDVETDKLKKVMREVYIEALNTEVTE